jgi:poly(3-hydroxybutyrate) depolymerase
LALILAFHGGGGSEEDFQQQSEFDQLGEQEKFIMAYAIAKMIEPRPKVSGS